MGQDFIMRLLELTPVLGVKNRFHLRTSLMLCQSSIDLMDFNDFTDNKRDHNLDLLQPV
jgi:hypothetical protein